MIPLQMSFREKHPVTHIAFSPDQGTVAVAQPHAGVTLLERGTGRTVAVCPTPRRGVLTGLAFTGDGRLLVAASAKGLSAFDAATGAAVAHSTRGLNNHLMLAAGADGVIGVKSDGRHREWPTAVLTDGRFNDQGPAGRSVGKLFAIGPASRLGVGVSSGAFSRVTLFDLVEKRLLVGIDRSKHAASAFYLPTAQFCPYGRRFAFGDGFTLDVYEHAEAASEEQYEDEQPATALVQRASGSGQVAAAVEAAPAPGVVLEPVFTLRPERPVAGEWRPPFALLADGRGLLVKRPRNRVQLWDAPAGALVNEWSWRLEWVTCLAVSPDGLTAVAGGRFGRVLLWNLD